jgi:hypothetical protein
MEKLDWLEQNGRGNLAMRGDNANAIRAQANTMLTLALGGGGGALYFAAKENHLTIAALLMSLYLFWVALEITEKCLMFGEYPSFWNTPKNLNQPNYELDELRKFELSNIQAAIEETKQLNYARSNTLNSYIKALCFTPLAAACAIGVDYVITFVVRL